MPVSTPIFRLIKPCLQERLRLVFPELAGHKFTVEARSLQAKAGSLNKATSITICRNEHPPIECVEKSIFKLPGFRPAELVVHDGFHALEKAVFLKLPHIHGRIETPLTSLVYTRLVRDEGVKMREVAAEIASGIAEIGHLSFTQISGNPERAVFKQLDFFQPWFLLRPRYNVRKALWMLDRLARLHPEAVPLAKRLRGLRPAIAVMERQLRAAPRCLSHLDYFRKNLMRGDGTLHLLDWGEARVGRIGFDAGAWLHAMLRIVRPEQFEMVRKKFLRAYFNALDPQFRNDSTMQAVRYLFTLRSLGYLLRPRIIREAIEQQSLDQLLLRLEKVADAFELTDWPVANKNRTG